VSIWFGTRIENAGTLNEVRQAVQNLGAEAVQQRQMRSLNPARAMVRACRRALWRRKIADSTGAELTGGRLLMASLLVRRVLLRSHFRDDELHIGLLLPPSVAGVLANAAVTLARRITANLNYTVSSQTLNTCIALAGIRHVLTSRKVAEKLQLDVHAELVYLEDVREQITLSDKLVAALQTYLMPAWLLERVLGIHRIGGDDVLTVIFTSGSTGDPKGVMLTHRNIASNVEAIDQVVQLRRDDCILGILPFFHSFGFTASLWTVLNLDVRGVYHFSPLDAQQVAKLCREHHATFLLSAPTFLRAYLKRCAPEDLASLEVVVAGAEKLPSDLAAAFEARFGVRPVEGYGTTELSPLVSVNVPPSRSPRAQLDAKEGTVGRPIPGVSAKTVDPDSLADLPVGQPGMLLIRGPNVMKGYLGQPAKTAEVIRDGWYVTGDIARIDDDGFIQITGRVSRFSKIGGEMVPHIRIEEAIQRIVAQDEGEIKAVVSSVPDPRKGERLIVLHTELAYSPDEICQKLADEGLPNLWIPSPDSFHQVAEIPLLGSGKVDLKAAQLLSADAHAAAQRQ
jgi:acyl-[acyl-carrier-protein]-phospholipid O-acyltransferase/long-chain-fatty-acid--[acyl-carrier-protein] ligase